MPAKVRSLTVSPYPHAECDECDWSLPYSRTTTAAACKSHVIETGHCVSRVRETIDKYYPVDTVDKS